LSRLAKRAIRPDKKILALLVEHRGRRGSRPEELRAINAVDDAIARGVICEHQDLIIALEIEHKAV